MQKEKNKNVDSVLWINKMNTIDSKGDYKGINRYLNNGSRTRSIFSYQNNEILLNGTKISKRDIEDIKAIKEKHIIPLNNEIYQYESLIWVISNQRVMYEEALKFMIKDIHGLPLNELKDPETVYSKAKKGVLKWLQQNKFEPLFEYMKNKGGIEKVVGEFIENPFEMRDEISKIKWIKNKSASLWYLTLGGDDSLIILDTHLSRQVASLGIDIPKEVIEGYIIQSGNNKGKRGRRSLSKGQYQRVEKDLTKILMSSNTVKRFSKEFINKDGKLNGCFTSIFLWWMAVQSYRNENLRQLNLLDLSDKFVSPYRELENK
tara:strand:+ start:2264 stop:3217 length:954 start_codon:yes stop_codon:yes gene_type:complete